MSLPKSVFPLLLIATVLAAVPCFADSQVRIVRLSDVQGDVSIDRATGQGYERAIMNLPITQGVKVKTGNGRAELEFEDGSSVRLVPGTVIEVPQLSLRDSGAKLSGVRIQEGTAYFNFLGSKNDEFDISFVREKITLTQAAHIRVRVDDTMAEVGAFKGNVEVEGPSGNVEVSKNHKAVFDLTDQDKYKVARDFEEEPFDAWDKQQDQYRDRYASNSYSSYSPYAYGTSDLNYYGTFSNVPGYGTMWQPYFAGAGWDPFMSGAWAFTPGLGYGWVSGYPWGWTPYHYGSWMYVPMYGWMWQPGGAWMGLNATPVFFNAPATYVPPRLPSFPGPRIVNISNGPRIVQVGNSPTKVQIPNNSAGLGLARGSVPNLSALSHTAVEKGFVDTRVHTPTIGWDHASYGSPSRTGYGVGSASAGHVGAAGHVSSGHSGGGSSHASK